MSAGSGGTKAEGYLEGRWDTSLTLPVLLIGIVLIKTR